VRRRLLVSAIVLLAVGSSPAAGAAPTENPCQGPEARELLCPNLRIGPAAEMYVDRAGPGRVLLRATSDVRSRGRGPIELRGTRNGWRTMTTRQRIYRVGGGHIDVDSEATLRFTDVGAYWGGGYWKVHQLAQFDLRPVLEDGSLGDPVRTSPKLNYCLRDLERTRAGRHSPPRRYYPGCDQNPYRDRVRLGTSVGWSDIYPAPYHQQWINVAGLSGCFVFEMTVDPRENLFESNERDNSSRRRVQLPFDGSGC
jgi:hypothetical protein